LALAKKGKGRVRLRSAQLAIPSTCTRVCWIAAVDPLKILAPALDDIPEILSLESRRKMTVATRSLSPVEPGALTVVAEAIRTVSAKARDQVITPDSRLFEDLALDSLDLVAVILQIQDHYQVEIDPDEISSMRLVTDVVASLDKQLPTAA
jgi:acyl carrier protein